MLPASILAVLLLSIAFQCHAVLVNVTTTSRPKDGSINQPITGKWLAQLKTCSNGKPHFLVTLYRITYPVDSQMAGIKQRLLNSSTGLIVGRIYNFSDFCGFSLHVQPNTDALTLQSQTANNNQLETQLHKSFIESLSADENILQIASDMPVVVDAAVARRVTQRDATWNLQRINQRFLPLNPNYSYDERAGSGVDVYVLDTGILTAHPEFGGRASIGAVFTGESEETGDINGHGTTHC